jgi:hypothetical protein
VVVRLASGALLGVERIMREFVAGLSGLIGRARGGSGGMASYCMVGVDVAGGSGGLAGDGLCGGAGLAWLSARLPGGLGEASCCIVAKSRAGDEGGMLGGSARYITTNFWTCPCSSLLISTTSMPTHVAMLWSMLSFIHAACPAAK